MSRGDIKATPAWHPTAQACGAPAASALPTKTLRCKFCWGPHLIASSSHLMHQTYDTFYTSRHSVRELCCDYPADEPLVEGLYAMQMHLVNRGAVLTIPVLNVMNTAHYIAACMMQTGAEGDQYEYDTLAYMRLGHDAQVAMLAIMVLATMLKRTDGQRARQCRNVLLEDRNEDFYEGLSLYERFISSSERRFEEQDFLTDTMRQISDLQNTVQQLTLEKQQLKQQLKQQMQTMNQYNQYNAPIYNYNAPVSITNNYYTQPPTAETHQRQETSVEDIEQVATEPQSALPFFVPEKLAELGTATAEEFDALYHNAVQAGAPKLATFIKHYRGLQVLNTKGYNKKKTYEQLKAYFGEELGFGYANFAAYY